MWEENAQLINYSGLMKRTVGAGECIFSHTPLFLDRCINLWISWHSSQPILVKKHAKKTFIIVSIYLFTLWTSTSFFPTKCLSYHIDHEKTTVLWKIIQVDYVIFNNFVSLAGFIQYIKIFLFQHSWIGLELLY
jgi:hypothetical protein